MLDTQALHTLLNLNVKNNALKFIVYTENKSERLQYVCEFIFNHVLNVSVVVTSDVVDFHDSPDFKINYSQKKLGETFQILPQGLLFEKDISAEKPKAILENELIYFFEKDIFSAVFYFISRYEEWQAFQPDLHNRFEVRNSILFQYNFHTKPVVDIWIKTLERTLINFYPTLKFPERQFKVISTIDVDNLFAYKSKGFFRTFAASIKDVLKADFKNLSQRFSVLSGKKRDPFDIYESVSAFCEQNNIPLIYFFLFRSGTKNDRTVNPKSFAFQSVFETLKEKQAHIGIHPSYNSVYEFNFLMQEIKLLSEKSNQKINMSRQHYLRFDIRTTPNLLSKRGIVADFTMGFASDVGFRAGTSHPFYYYDFSKEKKGELLFVPFCAMDGAYFVYNKIDAETAFNSLLSLASEIKKVNGIFITVFHERTFSDHLYPHFGDLYKNLHLKLKAL